MGRRDRKGRRTWVERAAGGRHGWGDGTEREGVHGWKERQVGGHGWGDGTEREGWAKKGCFCEEAAGMQ
ncbi:hypothetical protein KTO58_18675 [Chitinophaga pendula]|uniref:hypothetical protein n=1 Tax=Chitinophaga TaxID=79328 RepID=UPI0012FD0FEA|nr:MULTISPECIES: hypothetical protein [Chitinophaga]UCJ05701.1 hypothetical protein KTO58_18675 [Chitinophaga pendula]